MALTMATVVVQAKKGRPPISATADGSTGPDPARQLGDPSFRRAQARPACADRRFG